MVAAHAGLKAPKQVSWTPVESAPGNRSLKRLLPGR